MMKKTSAEFETAERLMLDLTSVQRFAGEPEIVAGDHPHLGFIVLIREHDFYRIMMDDRGSACLSKAHNTAEGD